MKSRKKNIIDRKFQLRTVFSVTAIAMIFFAAVIAVIIFFSIMSRNNISTEIRSLEKAAETEDNIVTAFAAYARAVTGLPVKLSIDVIQKDHAESMGAIQDHIVMLKRYADYYFYLLFITIAIMIALAAVYYFYLIRITHRMSGPVFVMSRCIQDLIDGREPRFRSLREKDEFKEMYRKLIELGEKITKGRSPQQRF